MLPFGPPCDVHQAFLRVSSSSFTDAVILRLHACCRVFRNEEQTARSEATSTQERACPRGKEVGGWGAISSSSQTSCSPVRRFHHRHHAIRRTCARWHRYCNQLVGCHHGHRCHHHVHVHRHHECHFEFGCWGGAGILGPPAEGRGRNFKAPRQGGAGFLGWGRLIRDME